MRRKALRQIQITRFITILVLIVIVVLSFMPIIPYENVVVNQESHTVVSYYGYYMFFSILFVFIRDGTFLSFFFALTIIAFYVVTVFLIIYLIIGKSIQMIILFILDALLMVPTVVNISYASLFSLITCISLLTMLIANCFVEYMAKISNKKKSKMVSRELMVKTGAVIKEKRKEKGLTQEQLASKLFVSRSLIAKYEAGVLFPDEKQLAALDEILGINDAQK